MVGHLSMLYGMSLLSVMVHGVKIGNDMGVDIGTNNLTIPEHYVKIVESNCQGLLNGTKNYTELATNVFKSWDRNGDGVVNLDEELVYEDEHHFLIDADIHKAWFSQYDIDGDGYITQEEFVFAVVGSDVNGDGDVTRDECMEYDIKKLRNAFATLRNSSNG